MKMKHIFSIFATCAITMAAQAQTLSIEQGNVSYRFPAALAGEMTFANGTTLTILDKTFTLDDISAMSVDAKSTTELRINIPDEQQASYNMVYDNVSPDSYKSYIGGLRLNFKMEGVNRIELESVDGNTLAGSATRAASGEEIIDISRKQSIITLLPPNGGTFQSGTDYYIATFPCDLYSGYRLSIFKQIDGVQKVADFYGVHQVTEAGKFIAPIDLDESELEFDDIDAPLVEEDRPELDNKTKELLREYKINPCIETYNALYEQMGVRYDKVVARKKAKLRELEREAHHQYLIDEMQGIVDEMVNNREERLRQRFLSLIDSRKDDDPTDEWLVLKGATENNAYVGYAPVTNAEYASFNPNFKYPDGQERYPVVNVSYDEAVAYCNWLGSKDATHIYRLPTEYEWILAAGHMPKDVNMNANFVESGLTSVDAYAGSKGNCGGIDFWGNCWEWTSTTTSPNTYLIKGGAWDSNRDACRSEYCNDSRDGSKGYPNVGIRVVRTDK